MIRRATAEDHDWIIATAIQAYADLGDYDVVMSSWLAQPGVLAWLETGGGTARETRRGFALLGFYQERLPPEVGQLVAVADILAIAVADAYRRRGVATTLLHHVITVAGRTGPSQGVHEVRLTVAADNVVSQRMYERAGFQLSAFDPGPYASGQRALRMVRALP